MAGVIPRRELATKETGYLATKNRCPIFRTNIALIGNHKVAGEILVMQVTLVSRAPEFGIHPRALDAQRALDILDILDKPTGTPLIKCASGGAETAMAALLQALAGMNLKVNVDLGELIRKVKEAVAEGGIEKYAGTNTGASREDKIVIASKELKDSHYQVDITKDTVTRSGKKLILVCAYLRDTYLGRYLIKRNFFYTADNNKDADATYDEMAARFRRIKARYHDDRIPVNSIFVEAKTYLDSVKADIAFNGDEEKKG